MAYLSGFGLENFRVFKEYTWFDFAPITILVGPNNSGKSSLIKALLLFQDNIKQDRGPISTELEFSGNMHKLGEPNLVLSSKSDSNSFSYVIPIYTTFDSPFSNSISIRTLDDEPIQFTEQVYRKFDFIVEDGKAINYYQENLVIANLTPIYTRKDYGKVYLNLPLLVNLISYPTSTSENIDIDFNQITNAINIITNFLIVLDVRLNSGFFEDRQDLFYEINLWNSYQVEEFSETPNNESLSDEEYDDYIHMEMGQIVFEGKNYQLPGVLKNIFKESSCIRSYLKTLFPAYNEIDKVADAVCFCLRFRFTKKSNYKLGNQELGYNISWPHLLYLPSIKGEQKRSFMAEEGSFINTLIQSINHKPSISQLHEEFFQKWTQKFNLGEIQIKTIKEFNINYIEVGSRSLVDVGYGYTQLITLLMTIVTNARYKDNSFEKKFKNLFFDRLYDIRLNPGESILLEEPETNLHPKFQSLLADMINEARTFINQFIIETHSEYLIRKFQYLVAKGEVKPEDVVIYYFNDPNNIPAEEKQVKKINILEDGSLSDDFGPGFYDEADNLAINLFNLQKSRRN